jgi:hypothetical protein
MREIALFVEDFAHRQVIGALVQRMAQEAGIEVRLDWRNARRGHGKVVQELKDYLRDLGQQSERPPDLIIVATDANCKGLNGRVKDLQTPAPPPARMIMAIPDPHIERWLLLDSAAFKAVFDRGCDAPDQKCSRGRYKELLIRAIYATGISPNLGGIEFAGNIVEKMDIDRAAHADRSFGRFVNEMRGAFRGWQS